MVEWQKHPNVMALMSWHLAQNVVTVTMSWDLFCGTENEWHDFDVVRFGECHIFSGTGPGICLAGNIATSQSEAMLANPWQLTWHLTWILLSDTGPWIVTFEIILVSRMSTVASPRPTYDKSHDIHQIAWYQSHDLGFPSHKINPTDILRQISWH